MLDNISFCSQVTDPANARSPQRRSRVALALPLMLVASFASAQLLAPVQPTATPSAAAGAGESAAATASTTVVPGAAGAPMNTSVATGPAALASLAWLQGCWGGKANQREFTEQWTRPAGGMMLGLGQTVVDGTTSSFEYMRIELARDGKVRYIAQPIGKPEEAFEFQGIRDDSGFKGHVFADPSRDFPSEIMYTPTTDNQLFVYVSGKVGGSERKVVYPFRRLDCATGNPL